MEDLRKLLSPISGNDPAVVRRKKFDEKPWAIKYLGRKLNATCLEKFPKANSEGFKVELPWEGQERHVSYNAYDDSTFVHELVISVYKDGPSAGRISDVSSYHWDHWHTSSNWQDHSESSTTNTRCPNDKEIELYDQMLSGWTVGGSEEQIEALVERVITMMKYGKGAYTASYTGLDGTISISYRGVQAFSLEVSVPDLMHVLDLSHLYPEVLISQNDRIAHWPESKDKLGVDYCVPLFDILNTPSLYPDCDGCLDAWLHELFNKSKDYRDFMGMDTSIWWRDARWRLQELTTAEYRSRDSRIAFDAYVAERGKCSKHKEFITNQFEGFAGRIGLPANKCAKQFCPDDGKDLEINFKDGRRMPEFHRTVINGVEWSYCHQYNKKVVINLADSRIVDESIETIEIPARIEGRKVSQIRSLGQSNAERWRHVVVPACEPEDEWEDVSIEFGNGAFRGWRDLESVVVKSRVRRCGDFTFAECVSLKKVDFEDTVRGLGDSMFNGCVMLADVGCIHMSCLTYAGCFPHRCFMGCKKLAKIEVQCYGSAITIGESAFEGCECLSSFTAINIQSAPAKDNDDEPSYPGVIGWHSFKQCLNLSEVVLPAGVKIIEGNAFDGCESLKVVQTEGSDFWFTGENCLNDAGVIYWGRPVKYRHEDEMTLSELLKTLDVEREKYIQCSCDPRDSVSNRIDFLTGKIKRLPRHDYAPTYYDTDDYTPRTFEDAYEIYGSRLWDA